MTMAASIEARAPFLDHRLAEFVSALPDELRVRGLATKWILRQAAQRRLPAEPAQRPQGRLPRAGRATGCAASCASTCCDHLQRRGLDDARLLRRRASLDRVLDEHLDGRQQP